METLRDRRWRVQIGILKVSDPECLISARREGEFVIDT
jgi:hypothetical protein